MKATLLGTVLFLLSLAACEPEPLPELEEQIIGNWTLVLEGTASYSSIFSYQFSQPASAFWQIEFKADGTAEIRSDSVFQTHWEHVDRDNLILQIPEGLILPELGGWECSFEKKINTPERQQFFGSGVYKTDTAVVDQIFLTMYWDLERIQ
ncbi:MAG: hypothetical protein AAGM67_08355 [Bacteroidota bacterium]